MTRLFAHATRRQAPGQISYVAPIRYEAAHGLVADVYAQVERDFGLLAPPVILHAPAPDVLAAAWALLRETLVAGDPARRAVKEAVAAGVSRANTCPYCVDVHGAMLFGLARDADAAAVAAGRFDAVGDRRLREAVTWAARTGTDPRAPAPVEDAHRAETTGVALAFHYYNRMVSVFLPGSPFPPGASPRVRGGLSRVVGRTMRSSARRAYPPGAALPLLPADTAAPAGSGAVWAAGDPVITETFARVAAVLAAAGERSLPGTVRALVTERVAAWDGKAPPLAGDPLGGALDALPEADRPAGRLALLTALAAYRVDDRVVADFRATAPDDATLVEAVAWSAFTAACRVGAAV
ncbi:carboxymuconolactone decarboxylase family protein [Actinomadura flavalba]|uniref:carboxymuconolactone decarboxylase family protein n=1 Tax=Actinomadura flavalba TaxID=1120938 RepID=UPI000380190D|nr:carboxymuconolactone decarboxylase family protein [Actinomadura flavalba]